MILLGFDSLLLLYITLGLGLFTIILLGKIFKQPVYANPLGVLLAGLIFSTIYFNIVSFWWPVNYYSLIPLFATSSLVFNICRQQRAALFKSIRGQIAFITVQGNLFFTLPVLAALLYYWIIPPINIDSGGYHYSSILWYEKYKAIPGLGNVHGRFAFNPVSFIIQAAYSFTGLTGQSLYPLNGVTISMFLLWLLKRVVQNKNTLTGLVYFMLFFLLGRALLLNISSPSPDALFIVCLAYSFIKIFDALAAKKISPAAMLLPTVLLLFALTAKMAAYPALLLLPFIFYVLRGKQKALPNIIKLFAAWLPMYLPWLCRNVILSGYLIYPLPYFDFFTFDWKVPKDVLMLDYIYIKHFPKLFSRDFEYLKSLPFNKWFFKWLSFQTSGEFVPGLIIFLCALFSPVCWLILFIKNKKKPGLNFVLWSIMYVDMWVWLNNSPEYRFGIVYLAFAILLPLMAMAGKTVINKYKSMPVVLAILMFAMAAYYLKKAHWQYTTYTFTINNCWLYPLKDKRYFYNNNKASFKYTWLNTGIKLFYEDSAHECINTDLPCMITNYGVIEMRGAKMEDGFRNVKNEVAERYPFVK